jgi:hypothetical protein
MLGEFGKRTIDALGSLRHHITKKLILVGISFSKRSRKHMLVGIALTRGILQNLCGI